MIVTSANLDLMFRGFSTAYNKAMAAAPSYWNKVAMEVPSQARDNTYGWLGDLPRMREWVGSRVIHNLKAHGYTVVNRDFEATVGVPRNDIEDDQFGVLGPVFEKMGRDAAMHPDELIFGLLRAGNTSLCYDGQYFFDTDHPVGQAGATAVTNVSNWQGGAAPFWCLLDCSQPIKPLLFQKRRAYDLVRRDRPEDDNVFFNKEVVYGVDARGNAGFGLWQLAYGSQQALTPASYSEARRAMMSQKGDHGQPLNVRPTHLVTSPALEAAALEILQATIVENKTNIWAGTAELVLSQYLL